MYCTYLEATGTHGGKCERIMDFCKLDILLFFFQRSIPLVAIKFFYLYRLSKSRT